MQQALIYIRFSTPKQEHGDSFERQLREAQAHCDRKGWTVVEPPIADRGRSAYKGDHLNGGELGKLTKRIEAGQIAPGTILVVEQLDRLSRQGHQIALGWLQRVCTAGIKVSVVQGDRLYDAEGLNEKIFDVIEVLIRAKLAHDESLNKGRRVAAAWSQKLEAAKSKTVLTKGCPGWLEVAPEGMGEDDTGFRIIPERAAVIRQIFEWCADGYGVGRIVRKLNDAKVLPWSRHGSGWSPTHILRLIEAPMAEGDFIPYYANRQKPDGERIVGYYPRVVDADLVARAKAGLISRRRSGGPRYENGWGNLFLGTFVCSNCRGNMTVKRGPQRREGKPIGPAYIGCVNAGLNRGCDRRQLFRYRDFEEAAVSEMLSLVLDDRFFQKPDRTVQLSIASADAKKDLNDRRERAKRLIDLFSRLQSPEVEQELVGLTDTIRDIEARVKELDGLLAVAKGEVIPAEHIKRVLEVRSELASEDKEVRLAARMRVHEAIKGVVDQVVCDAFDRFGNGEPKKTFTLILAGGVQAMKFSNVGEKLGEFSLVAEAAGDEELRNALSSGGGDRRARLDAYLRQRADTEA